MTDLYALIFDQPLFFWYLKMIKTVEQMHMYTQNIK